MGAGEPVEGKLLDHDEMAASPVVAVVVEETRQEEEDDNLGEPAHFWAACCSTYFCHLVGLVYALVFANTRSGRVGAIMGLQLSTLKVALLALCAAITASSMTEFREFRPAAVHTPQHCDEVGGAWVLRTTPVEEPQQQQQLTREGDALAWHHHHRHRQHGVQFGAAMPDTTHFCSCPRLSLQRVQDGAVVCSSAATPLAAFAIVYFFAFTLLTAARLYL